MAFKQDIIEILTKISEEPQKSNDWAFLTVTGKSELPLRDKLALGLHEKYKDEYLVCREWERVDLAILDKDGTPVCLIECKAQSLVKYEENYYYHLNNDLHKIQNIAKDNKVELFYIYFNNMLFSEKNYDEIYPKQLKYISSKRILNYIGLASNQSLINDCKSHWQSYLTAVGLVEANEVIDEPLEIKAGKYYDYTVSILTFIYGPANKEELKSKSLIKRKKNEK